MSSTARVRAIVAILAVAAAGTVTGVVLATRQDPPQPKPQCTQRARPLIVPGVRSKEVAAVKAALAKPALAAAHSLEPIEQRSPKDPIVQFNYGVVLFCSGYLDEATQAFRAAKTTGRDTYYEMRADEILHPQYFAPADGLYPLFEPVGKNPLLLRGLQLQRQGHQHSAERVYARAATLHPDLAEAQVAAAVGRFDEDDLSASFSRLGPLVKRFPQSQSVRYHLGLLLAWTGQRRQAAIEFRLARSLGPGTRFGKESSTFLRGLVASGTSTTQR
ncbi:MAG: tetratricopeptide repeat protein [Gaiellaceae bacterium]